MKKVISLACTLLLSLSLTACGGRGLTAMDATSYVQGMMDQTYLGHWSEDYLASVDITKEQAQDTYTQGLEVEYAYFTYYFDMAPDYLTQDTHDAITSLLADIYQQSRYQVSTAEKQEEGFAVEVSVEPIDIIPLVTGKYMPSYSEDFAARYAGIDRSAITAEEEYAFLTAYENDWAMGIVELFRSHLDELGYLEARSVTVEIRPDDDGVHSLSEADFAALDALILAYSD